ncbi:MAG: alpha/beta hydrolase (plasmid) [Nodularia sp. CChRGM 3473]
MHGTGRLHPEGQRREGEQHGVALTADNACVNDIVADYLIGLKIPADGVRCVF